ncbi:MAG: MBL fold metallo-hydrolase [Clostridiales bacterium]|nr:MBL fold metallo-hydrolase [Clostridiales bacterium]
MARFCPLFSGSRGNSVYIGAGTTGILIDAGVSAKRLETALRKRDIDPASIAAIFVTHEHSDHIAGLRVFASRFATPVYASEGTLDELCRMGTVNGKFEAEPMKAEVCAGELRVTCFRTSHDAAESVGYCVETPDGRKITVATDLGVMTDEVRAALTGSDLVMMESNHDVRMLQNGGYPYYLKRRILSVTGHLSNDACACELPALAQSGVTRFVLGHLSRENNFPDIARQTALCSFSEHGMREGTDFTLTVAPQENEEKVMIF